MEYKEFSQAYENEVISLWNKCLLHDVISKEIFENKALFDENFDKHLTVLALDNNKVVGFLMATKRKFPYFERGLESEKAWINVFFVEEKYRNKGIGKTMHDIIIKKLKDTKKIIIASYSPNYFFYGVDIENYPESKPFLDKLGYVQGLSHYSMARDLHGFHFDEKNVNKYQTLLNKGYKFINFKYEYSLELLEFLKNEFGGGWKRNALIAMQKRKAEERIILVLDPNNKICGCANRAIDDNEMRFGPIGIGKDYRNEGIGSVLLNFCLLDMTKKGIYHMFFMTTDEDGKRYYERNGLHVIRTFVEYSKDM